MNHKHITQAKLTKFLHEHIPTYYTYILETCSSHLCMSWECLIDCNVGKTCTCLLLLYGHEGFI